MDFSLARRNMVENQIRTNKVTDAAVVEALAQIPRETFVPESRRAVAYVDEEVDLGGGRRLLEPMVFARMLQTAAIQPDEVVLDVGCGTGYSAAVLSRLAGTVIALESDRELAARARDRLSALRIANVELVEGPLDQGVAARAPYGAILVEGGIARSPDALRAQLADRGRLISISLRPGGLGQAELTSRIGNSFPVRPLFDAVATALPGFAARAGFVF